MPNSQRPPVRSYFLLFFAPFALAFAGLGILLAVVMGNSLLTWHSTQSWTEVPTHILHTQLKEYPGGKGGTTYNVTIEYAYEYHGLKYMCRNIAPFNDRNNPDTYRELSEYQKSGKPIRCYVNPARPEQAFLCRDLNLASIMLGVVGVGGVLGIVVVLVIAFRKLRASSALAKAYPETPWMWKPDWAAGRIVFSDKVMAVFSVLAAVLVNLVFVPLCFWLLNGFHKGSPAAWIGLLFPTVGLGLIVWAIVAVLRWRKFGTSVFRMASVPGVIGGQLAGAIQTSTKIRPADGFHLTLTCIRRTGAGKSTQEKELWQETQTVDHELLDDTAEISAIPVEFQIPSDCQPTDETNAYDKTIWRLKVTAKVSGFFNYSATFEVPVFKIPESDTLATTDANGFPPARE